MWESCGCNLPDTPGKWKTEKLKSSLSNGSHEDSNACLLVYSSFTVGVETVVEPSTQEGCVFSTISPAYPVLRGEIRSWVLFIRHFNSLTEERHTKRVGQTSFGLRFLLNFFFRLSEGCALRPYHWFGLEIGITLLIEPNIIVFVLFF